MKARLLPAHNNAGVDPQEALSDLRAVATKLGRSTVTNSAYCTHGRYSDGPLIRALGSWNGALQAAGLDVSKRARIPDDELFENLARVWCALGRQPKYGEVTKPLSAFSTGTYESRFGSSTETISLRLPAPLLSDLKALANKRDVPYQSLLKVFVADRVAEEWRSSTHPGARSNHYLPSPCQADRSSPSGRGPKAKGPKPKARRQSTRDR